MEACNRMVVLSMDNLERDPLSQDFVRNMQTRVQNLNTGTMAIQTIDCHQDSSPFLYDHQTSEKFLRMIL